MPGRSEGDRRRRALRKDRRYFGFDGQKAAIEQIIKGSNFVATGVNSADEIAKVGFKTMLDLLAGKKPAQRELVPAGTGGQPGERQGAL